MTNQKKKDTKPYLTKKLTKSEAKRTLNKIKKGSRINRQYIYDFKIYGGHLAFGYPNFANCVKDKLKSHLSYSRIYNELKAAQIEVNIGIKKIGTIPEGTLRPLRSLSPPDQKLAWDKSLQDINEGKRPTAKKIQQVIHKLFPEEGKSKAKKDKTENVKNKVEQLKEEIIKKLSSKSIRKLIRKLDKHLNNL